MVKPRARSETVEVTADGDGLVSHAGAALLVELADGVGLTVALSAALAETRERSSAHDPGRVLRDLAVMLADGGDCVTDIDAYRGQEWLFGARASETTTHRVLKSLDEHLLDRIRAARAAARARAWDAGARPETITLDIDAMLVTAHSEKEQAAGNYEHGYGFHPVCCYLDESGEALAAILRPGNAGSNTAAGHFAVLGLALAQLPGEDLQREILVRTDIGGATHAFTADCREANIRFSVGYELNDTARQAILDLPGIAWVEAINADGAARDGASVAELTEHVDLGAWPAGSRLIVRRERPQPGAQLTIFDEHGYRHTGFSPTRTTRTLPPWSCATAAAPASRTTSGPARTPACATSLTTRSHDLPWLEVSLIAQDLFSWTKLICLDGGAREPRSPSASDSGVCTAPQSSSTTGDEPTSSSIASGVVGGSRRRVPSAFGRSRRSAEHRLPAGRRSSRATPTTNRHSPARIRPPRTRSTTTCQQPSRGPSKVALTQPLTVQRTHRGHSHRDNVGSRLASRRAPEDSRLAVDACNTGCCLDRRSGLSKRRTRSHSGRRFRRFPQPDQQPQRRGARRAASANGHWRWAGMWRHR